MKTDSFIKALAVLKTLSPKDFDMGLYQTADKNTQCGSLGCVIGHVARVVGVTPEFKNFYGGIEYASWALNFFGVSMDSNEGRWAFNNLWRDTDNTIAGAMARIQYLIKHGEAPENSKSMLYGISSKEYLSIVAKYSQPNKTK